MAMPLEMHADCYGGSESPPTVQCVVDVHCSESQVITGTESDALGSSRTLNDNISQVDVKVAGVNDTQCCNCSRTFKRKKKPNNGVRRYSLKSLNLENTRLATKGNFVCHLCKCYFYKNRNSVKCTDFSAAKRNRGNSLTHEVPNQAACPNCYTVSDLDCSPQSSKYDYDLYN